MSRNVLDPKALIRNASTVLLVRDGMASLEVFVQRRVSTMAFCPNHVVFPGGGMDISDGRRPETTATRELLEETGVYLANAQTSNRIEALTAVAAARERLNQGDATFTDLADHLARNHGMVPLEPTKLVRLDDWITPAVPGRRYRVSYFITQIPETLPVQPDSANTEAVESYWTSPAAVLEQYAAGKVEVAPPTWWHLNYLTQYSSAAEAVASTYEKYASNTQLIQREWLNVPPELKNMPRIDEVAG